MIFQRHTVWTLALAIGAALTGCGGGADDGGVEVRFDIRNDSAAILRDVLVVGTLRPLSFGEVEPGRTGTLTGRAVQLPESVEVTWTDGEGIRQFQRVTLDSAQELSGAGPIVLKIDAGQNVTAQKG